MSLIYDILKTEVDETFIEGMKARMEISYHKYGPIATGAPKIDAIASLMVRLRKYAETGNTEWLMDVANFAMIEFMYPKHPEAHFRGTDSDESPGRVAQRTGTATDADNRSIGKNYVSSLTNFREK